MAQQHGLGRGLASLIPPKKQSSVTEKKPITGIPVVLGNFSNPDEQGRVLDILVEDIVANPHQPRLYFSEEKLSELAESIKEHGILQPLIVTKNGTRQYEIIAGERRLQAAKLAGLKHVPVIVREAKNQEKFELAIIENVQRHDLNPIEEAKAYRKLMDEFDLSQEAVAKKMGKSRSAVANITRLLQLPVEIQRAVAEGKISEGHAKALLALDNPEKQRALFNMIIAHGLTVRETEIKAREVSVHSHKRLIHIDPAMKAQEERLMEIFGTKVKINKAGKGGKIVIEYYEEEDLTHLIHQLMK
jgi:ParB family chromosome partitioning protein